MSVVALGIQHAMRMRHIVMRPFHLYSIFPRFLINSKIFGKDLLNIKCVVISSTACV
jgi:hypothetical protein